MMMKGSKIVLFCGLLLFVAVKLDAKFNDIEAGQKAAFCVQNDPQIRKDLTECFQNMLRDLPKEAEKKHPTAEDVANISCRVQPTACLSKFVANKCFSSEEQAEVHRVLDAFNAAFDYACDNDGAKIILFYNSGGPECIQDLMIKRSNEIIECVKDVITSAQPELEEVKDDEEKRERIGCSIIFKLKNCVLDNMNCTNPEPEEILEGVGNAFLKKTPCWAYVASSANNLGHESWLFGALLSVVALTLRY